jgi:hypothetical protein
MKVELRNDKLCIGIDLVKATPSSSDMILVVASTRGNTIIAAMVDEQ